MASVASKNPFALLGDEDASPTPAKTPSKKAPAAPEPAPKSKTANRGGPASRGGRYYNRGGARPNIEPNPNESGVQEPANSGKRFEGRGRGRGRGGRGGRGGDRGDRGDRPDRHSQTGKTDSDKKIHQGWGGDDGQAELKDETNAETDANKEAKDAGASEWDAPAGADDAEKPARKEREPEPEDNTLTLDQYRAQDKTALDVPELEARTVEADWTDVKPLEKTEDDDYYIGKQAKTNTKSRSQAAIKETVEVNFTTPQRNDGRGRGRGRGDRGRGGGERGERRGRGGSNRGGRQTAGPSIDDESAFPALS